ncbi:MAG: isoprenoid biosynthesis glyoxalase ElbB [Gammaproteobacteria bacterium]|nr:isoprenoid biosynthesis glyoxalase ElbB [Gammaproteobacteria bacterium]
MKRVAVILSGAGVYDGSEIHEAVLSLLALDRAGAKVQCFAPDQPQHHVINHLSGEVMHETRNVLVEAARIARGAIKPLSQARPEDFDAAVLPGGFGAAKNLCDFAFKGAECTVNAELQRFLAALAEARKPVGFICIAPAMIPRIYGKGAECTIGTDAQTAAALEAMGAVHQACPVNGVVVDATRRCLSTPAYMLAGSIKEAAEGIDALVAKVLALA